MTGRRAALVAVLFATLVAALAPAAAAPALAAGPGMTIVSNATYTVDPDHGVVHVAVNLTAANHLTDTKTRLYYFDKAFLAVPPNTAGFKVSARIGGPTVHVAAKTADHTLLRIDFGSRLGSGQARGMALTFDIKDPGGVPTRTTRVGTSLVAFGAWAYASEGTPGSTVTVVFPPGYTIDARSDLLRKPTTDGDGRTVYATGALAQPLAFFAYFVADRPSAFAESTRTVQVGGRPLDVTIRAWPDDPAWAERTGGIVEKGIPVLADAIGLQWTAERPFIVAEAVSQASSPYAGRYDPDHATVEVAYYADQLVTLHEMAHAWFDGGLLADRWANEGFASWYALDAASKLKLKVAPAELTPEMIAARIPLNAWNPLATDDKLIEDYGYAASARLAGLVAQRAGPDALAKVWQAIRDGVAPYQPTGLRSPGGAATNGVGSEPCPARTSRRSRPARRPPTGAASSTCSRTGPARAMTTCGGRGSSATTRPGCSTPGRRRGASTTRSWPRPASGGCRRSFATRCGRGSSARRRSCSPPRAARSTTATRCSRRRRRRT